MKITLIIGLPASGKTTLAKTLGGFLIDDPISIKILPNYVDHLIITDPYFCIDSILNKAINILYKKYDHYNVIINRIYFENDLAQCLLNSKLRNNKNVDNFIKHLSSEYIPNKNYKILPCYNNKQ